MEMKHGGPAAWILCAGLSCLLLSGCAARPGSGGSSAEERQCASGDGEACLKAGDRLIENLLDDPRVGGLFKALEHYHRGCQLGNFPACMRTFTIERRLEGGSSADLPFHKRVHTACTQEAGPACDTLAYMHYMGLGVPRDPERALAYAERACTLNEAFGCYLLADLYYEGEVV